MKYWFIFCILYTVVQADPCHPDGVPPNIAVNGDSTLVLETSESSEYTDQGATCEDYCNGALSNAVEVSGQIVNMPRPDVYTIGYTCKAAAGNSATATRGDNVENK